MRRSLDFLAALCFCLALTACMPFESSQDYPIKLDDLDAIDDLDDTEDLDTVDPVCPPGEHDGGDGRCLPIPECSEGFHDDGLGHCVGGDRCAPEFLFCDELCLAELPPKYCGECGTRCSSHERCVEGKCECADGWADCNEELGCETELGTQENCSVCHHACAPHLLCTDEKCACPGTQQDCDGICVDTSFDQLHCGSCGNACLPNEFCMEGKCQCGPGFDDCDGDGVCDALTTNLHCTACDIACGNNQRCTPQGCVCKDGFGDCDNDPSECETSLNAPDTCGSCTNACKPEELCQAPFCVVVCPEPLTECGGSCVDTQSSIDHCLQCFERCDGEHPACLSGVCGCEPGWKGALCDEPICALGCLHGTCIAPDTCDCLPTWDGPSCEFCASGLTQCGETCVDLTSNDEHCGNCGAACPWDQWCDGSCTSRPWLELGAPNPMTSGAEAFALSADDAKPLLAVVPSGRHELLVLYPDAPTSWKMLGNAPVVPTSLSTLNPVVDLQFSEGLPFVLFDQPPAMTPSSLLQVRMLDGVWKNAVSAPYQPPCPNPVSLALAMDDKTPHLATLAGPSGSPGCQASVGYAHWNDGSWWQTPSVNELDVGIVARDSGGTVDLVWDSEESRALLAMNIGPERLVRFWDTRLDPEGWSTLGESLNVSANTTMDSLNTSLSIAMSPAGEPTVAFAEAVMGEKKVYVKRYSSSGWELIGGPVDSADPADQVSLAFVDGVPMVAYVVGTAQHGTLHVRRLQGGDWVPHGQALSPTASKPSLANVNGVAHVAFYDHAVNSVRLLHFPYFPD